MSERILNIEHMLKESFKKAVGYDQVIVVVGNSLDDLHNGNYMTFHYCNNGNSDENIVQIKTTIPDTATMLLIIVQCLVSSGVRFDTFHAMNMDDTCIDPDNMASKLKLVVDLKKNTSKKTTSETERVQAQTNEEWINEYNNS